MELSIKPGGERDWGAASRRWAARIGDPALTITVPLGSAVYVNHPVHGEGLRLCTGTGAGDQAAIDITGTSLGHFSLHDVVTVAMSDTRANAGDTFSIRAKNAPDLSVGTHNATFGLNQTVGDDLLTARMDADTFAGPVVLPAKITGMRLRIQHTNAGGQPTSVCIFGVIKNRTQRRGTVMFDFDDGFVSQYTKAWAYMRPRGIVGNIAVIASTVGKAAGQVDAYDYCSLDQLHAIHETGWGMIPHGYYPHVGYFSDDYARIRDDIAVNQGYVAGNFDEIGARDYVFPAGQAGSTSNRALKELGFLSARGTVNEYQHAPPIHNMFRLRSHQLSAAVGLPLLKKQYDRVRDSGMTIRFNAHRIVAAVVDPANEILEADFNSLMDYVALDIQSGRVLNPSVPQWRAQQALAVGQ